jgi:hypothetical protein
MTDVAKIERDAIVAWLRGYIVQPHGWRDRNQILSFLWAVTHPFKFGQQYGRMKFAAWAADAIEHGDHIKETT